MVVAKEKKWAEGRMERKRVYLLTASLSIFSDGLQRSGEKEKKLSRSSHFIVAFRPCPFGLQATSGELMKTIKNLTNWT